MQKWEYCAIDGLRSGGEVYVPSYYRFTDKGFELISDFKNRPKGLSTSGAVGQFIAKLGEEGWELVGAGNTGEITHRIYFKRPKS